MAQAEYLDYARGWLLNIQGYNSVESINHSAATETEL